MFLFLSSDEAISALDPTSRVLVIRVFKKWREDRTTIVITRDLSQITLKAFIYVLRNGTVIEQGYIQLQPCQRLAMEDEEKDLVSQPLLYVLTTLMPTIHSSAMLGNWMFGMMADLTSKGSGPTPFCLAVLAASFLPMRSLDYFYSSMFSYPWATNPVLISYFVSRRMIYHPQRISHRLAPSANIQASPSINVHKL
ncbi:hypothetical protein ARMGADRAFT_1089193 [Armillaria gallica]|uniref:Uncharacterized protein n=1 Tax=Armillaria gallica TaxID=47427 RepID=A0A2H3CKE8_ARMGA|nr:hypothetical protein ARMGADRAFT_1089193 [Armillaria gallica]